MLQTYTAVVKQDEGAWIGWIEEVPGVNCQEATREELLKSLRITLTEVQSRRSSRCCREGLRRITYRGMKRRDLLQHPSANGCQLLREGA